MMAKSQLMHFFPAGTNCWAMRGQGAEQTPVQGMTSVRMPYGQQPVSGVTQPHLACTCCAVQQSKHVINQLNSIQLLSSTQRMHTCCCVTRCKVSVFVHTVTLHMYITYWRTNNTSSSYRVPSFTIRRNSVRTLRHPLLNKNRQGTHRKNLNSSAISQERRHCSSCVEEHYLDEELCSTEHGEKAPRKKSEQSWRQKRPRQNVNNTWTTEQRHGRSHHCWKRRFLESELFGIEWITLVHL
jgi:hypothetical protein